MTTAWIEVSQAVPAYDQRVLVKDVMVRIGRRISTDKAGDLWSLESDRSPSQHYSQPTEEKDRYAGETARDIRYWMPLPT